MEKTYHVSVSGNDLSEGLEDSPYRTISRAAQIAKAGDTVIVHEGEYREWVKPQNGGSHVYKRITYKAADGAKVVIKGSEIIRNWEIYEGSVWKAKIPNSFFGEFNPYEERISGDWFLFPVDYFIHAGDVYLNGKSFYEARSLKEVMNPSIRDKGYTRPMSKRTEYLTDPEDSIYVWFAEVDDTHTTIYANFHEADPNRELTEINVRQACFCPVKTGLNYITVKGFEMAQAATLWSPPTAKQYGLLGVNWSKGWIIEDNILHDSKCSAISIGKDATTGDMDCSRTQRKSGYQYQQEAVFKALKTGWSKEIVGSHTIRNNEIYDCGQNAIVGHLGCIYSCIHDNHIFRIGKKHEYFGYEIAGIKLHAAIDVSIRHNRIHDCSLGMWLDWQAQGTRVSSNLLYRNDRDCMIEVTHGPLVFDNNILASDYNLDNFAQGTAYIHNLFCGAIRRTKVMDRATPYHFPHSTDVAGYAFVYSGDDRIFNNIFIGSGKEDPVDDSRGTSGYDANPPNYEAYQKEIIKKGKRDEDKFAETEQPVYIDCNAYLSGAHAFRNEKNCFIDNRQDSRVEILEENSGIQLEIVLSKGVPDVITGIHSTDTLGTTRITECSYDNPEGKAIVLDKDFLGHKRSAKPTVGPFENLSEGKSRVVLW